eukprot:SAG11_NODE_14020_length_628_cov_1.368620_1_plen_92_part_00
MEVSAYRFHEEDPLAFSDGKPVCMSGCLCVSILHSTLLASGVKVEWRIADILNYNLPSPKCFIEHVNQSAGDQSLGGSATTVTSYVWVYTW